MTSPANPEQIFMRLFQASPAPFLVLKPDAPHFTIIEVNDAYLSATMRTRDEVVGRGLFKAFPDNPSDEHLDGVNALRASLGRVLASRQPDTLLKLQYDVTRRDGTFERRWWSPVNSAVLDDNGNVAALIHNANDVTDAHQFEIALRESEGRHAVGEGRGPSRHLRGAFGNPAPLVCRRGPALAGRGGPDLDRGRSCACGHGRSGEERQAFLLRLSDAMRAEPSADAVADRALRTLLDQIRLDRCYIGTYRLAEDIGAFPHQVHDDSLPPLPAQARLSDFPKGL